MRALRYVLVVLKRKYMLFKRKEKPLVKLSLIKRFDRMVVMGDNFPSTVLSYLIENKNCEVKNGHG